MKIKSNSVTEVITSSGGEEVCQHKIVVETDSGIFDLGSVCGTCGRVFVPRIYRKDGELVSTVWCPKCKE